MNVSLARACAKTQQLDWRVHLSSKAIVSGPAFSADKSGADVALFTNKSDRALFENVFGNC